MLEYSGTPGNLCTSHPRHPRLPISIFINLVYLDCRSIVYPFIIDCVLTTLLSISVSVVVHRSLNKHLSTFVLRYSFLHGRQSVVAYLKSVLFKLNDSKSLCRVFSQVFNV